MNSKTRGPRNNGGILIVEDQRLIAESLAAIAKRCTSEPVNIAASPELAIDVATRVSPWLVLLDVNLGTPDNGINVAYKLRDICNPCIVFLTAQSLELDWRLEQLGNYTYLQKPIDDHELVAIIDAHREPRIV